MAMLNEIKKPRNPKSQGNGGTDKKSGKLVTLIALGVLVVSAIVIITYLYQSISTQIAINKWNKEHQNSLNPEVSATEPANPDEVQEAKLLPFAEKLLAENPDTVGFISVPNTNVSFPVVRSTYDEGMQNEYYRTHDFYGNKNKKGAIYADFRTIIDSDRQSDNIVLYGHNELDNTMFGDLDKYKTQGWKTDFYKENPTFTFDTNYEHGTYKIFAYFVTAVLPEHDSQYPIFDYQNYIEFDEARYDDFIDNVMRRTQILTDVDVQYGDRFVTLSTCSSEFEPSRFVIVARKVRDGESPEVNVENAVRNPDAQDPDWDTIYKK